MGFGPGAALEAYGNKQAADASQNANLQRQDEAQSIRNRALSMSQDNQTKVMALAAASPQELSAYGDSLNAAHANLQNQQKLLDAVDPSLMEASKQILNIMQGHQTSMGGQYENGRNSQRQQLVNSLRSQYGPGAESSSIGRQALNQFDMQTSQGGIGVQNQALNTLGGVMGMGQSLQQGVQSGIGTLSGAGNNFSMMQQRQLNAQYNTGQSNIGAWTGTSQNVLDTTGAGQIGAQLQGRGMAQIGRSWQESDAQLGSSFASSMGSMGKSAAMA